MTKMLEAPSDGKRAGYVTITTRSPEQILNYIKHQVAPKFGGTLTNSYELMIDAWFAERPNEHGLPWQETKALSHREERKVTLNTGETGFQTFTIASGWVQVNLLISKENARYVRHVADENRISASTVLYTMMYWWAWHKHPPVHIAKQRADAYNERIKKSIEEYKATYESEPEESADGGEECDRTQAEQDAIDARYERLLEEQAKGVL